MDINSQFNQRLLKLYLFLKDEKEVTYDSFSEYEPLLQSDFTKIIAEFKRMIGTLHLKCSFFESVIDNKENPTQFKKKIYYFQQISDDYSFELTACNSDDKQKYIYVIFYLMIRNHQYVSLKTLNNVLSIVIEDYTFKRLVTNINKLMIDDLQKNELQSYVVDEW